MRGFFGGSLQCQDLNQGLVRGECEKRQTQTSEVKGLGVMQVSCEEDMVWV